MFRGSNSLTGKLYSRINSCVVIAYCTECPLRRDMGSGALTADRNTLGAVVIRGPKMLYCQQLHDQIALCLLLMYCEN